MIARSSIEVYLGRVTRSVFFGAVKLGESLPGREEKFHLVICTDVSNILCEHRWFELSRNSHFCFVSHRCSFSNL